MASWWCAICHPCQKGIPYQISHHIWVSLCCIKPSRQESSPGVITRIRLPDTYGRQLTTCLQIQHREPDTERTKSRGRRGCEGEERHGDVFNRRRLYIAGAPGAGAHTWQSLSAGRQYNPVPPPWPRLVVTVDITNSSNKYPERQKLVFMRFPLSRGSHCQRRMIMNT